MATCQRGAPGATAVNALVLDADNRAALEAVQSLARRHVAVDVAADGDCLTLTSGRVHEHFLQPDAAQPQAFLQWLSELDQRNQYSLIIPSSEASLRPFLSLSESDPIRQKAVLPSNESLQTALDKSLTLRLASSLQIPVPETVVIRSENLIPPCNAYPVVLKPVSSQLLVGNHMKQVRPVLANNDVERRGHLRQMLQESEVLQQEYVPGYGFGVEALYDKGKLVWFFCHERLHEGANRNGLGSGSTYRRSVLPEPELLRHAKALLDRLQWHGVAMVEFKCADDGRYWLMEINARLWGSLALAIDAGVDFPYGLLCLAAGQPVPAQPKYRVNYHTRLLALDLVWIGNRFFDGRRASALVETLKLLRPVVGQESWDYFDWGDLAVTNKVVGTFVAQKLKLVKRRTVAALQARAARRLHRQNLRRLLASDRPAQSVLFLCFGNICRSPASELLMKIRHPQLDVSSAGFYPVGGRSSPKEFQDVAKELAIDLAGWSSQRVSIEMVRNADIIFLHDMRNYNDFCAAFGGYKHKALLLGMFLEPASLEIKDPFEAGFTAALQILKQISAAIDAVASQLSWSDAPDERDRSSRRRVMVTVANARSKP
jgi:protein-tyrosine-phosphatase/predicted ATP-grasp superfamily ATP-dependent carboligase